MGKLGTFSVIAASTLVAVCGVEAIAAPIQPGTAIGIEFNAPTNGLVTPNYNGFSENGTKASGTVVSTTGTTVDNVAITFNVPDDGGFNGDGVVPDNKPVGYPFPDSVTDELVFGPGGATTTLTTTITGLDTSLTYNVLAAASIPGDSDQDFTVAGATSTTQTLSREDGRNGAFFNFASVSPTGAGQLVLTLSSPTGNPVLNGIIIQAVPEPGALSLLGLGAIGLLRRRRAKH